MKLAKLEVKGLYGSDYELNFHEDVSLLYGLNGSGKTTILNIVYHVLQGELLKILEYKFSKLSMEFNGNEIKKLEILINEDDAEIKMGGKTEKVYMRENFNFIKERLHISDDEMESSLFENKSDLRRVIHSGRNFHSDILEEIKSFTETLYIPINRRVRGIKSKHNTTRNGILYRESNKRNIEDSLSIAQSFFNEYLNSTSLEERKIMNEDKEKMLKKISSPVGLNPNRVFDKDLGKIISGYKSNFQELGIGDISKLIKNYERTSDSFSKDPKTQKIEIKDPLNFAHHSFAIAQIVKIVELYEISVGSERKIQEAKETINNVIDSVNSLFEDTGKEIIYNYEEREIKFILEGDSKELSINYLSSGEKQLLIFFIFSLINSRDIKHKKHRILLIDEPELSLHIEWQSEILSKLNEVVGHTQFIIATHSPDIIGDNHDKMVSIKGVRNT